jgi:hypothetical protein
VGHGPAAQAQRRSTRRCRGAVQTRAQEAREHRARRQTHAETTVRKQQARQQRVVSVYRGGATPSVLLSHDCPLLMLRYRVSDRFTVELGPRARRSASRRGPSRGSCVRASRSCVTSCRRRSSSRSSTDPSVRRGCMQQSPSCPRPKSLLSTQHELLCPRMMPHPSQPSLPPCPRVTHHPGNASLPPCPCLMPHELPIPRCLCCSHGGHRVGVALTRTAVSAGSTHEPEERRRQDRRVCVALRLVADAGGVATVGAR